MNNSQGDSIRQHFSKLDDPRNPNVRHILSEIITIAICAIICGADAYTQFAEFGRSKEKWFRKFMQLPHGIPSHDTFGRVFSLLDPECFGETFRQWVIKAFPKTQDEIIAIDGKTLRRSHDHNNSKRPIHMVSAWASKCGIVLGQIKTDEKSNEITAIPALIKAIDIENAIVTTDAMGCQKKIASDIVQNNGDYVLALKENHPDLIADIKLFFSEQVHIENNPVLNCFETIDGDHGRIETRRYYVCSTIDGLASTHMWDNLNSIAMVQRQRDMGDTVSHENAYYLSSIDKQPEKVVNAIRNHWSIENSLHWQLDVSFDEDRSRIRKDHAPENLAVLRHIALNLLKQEKSLKAGIKTKRLKAAWDDQYRAKILSLA
jgi:predicted transposase YbfD/YdcC